MAAASRSYTLEEARAHTSDKDCWLIIHGKVYDVTNFLDEHPGGYDIVVSNAGKDATDDFEEIGHSNTAKDMLAQYLIGTFAGGDPSAAKPKKSAKAAATPQGGSGLAGLIRALLPLLVVALAIYFALTRGSK